MISRRDFFRIAATSGPVAALGGAASAGAALVPAPAVPAGGLLRAGAFGAVGDGRADDTDALVALLAAMQQQGLPGLLGGAGPQTRYSIRTGALRWTFDNSGTVDLPGPSGPTLFTAGRVVLAARPGSPDAPFMAIHNDPRHGGRFVHGGYVGPLIFEDRTGEPMTGRHGLALGGVEAMTFGPIASAHLAGDLVRIERHGDILTGDSWHVSHCVFEALATFETQGWTLNNASLSQFFNLNQIGFLWNIGGRRGLWRGPGAGNWCRAASASYCQGWAMDWTPEEGNVQVNTVEHVELDGPEYGLRIDGVNGFTVGNARIVHRYREFGAQIADSGAAWPKVAIALGGNSGKTTSDGTIRAFHYLKPGITPASVGRLGLLLDMSDDPTVARIDVSSTIVAVRPNVRVGDDRLLARVNPNSRDVDVRYDGRAVLRTANNGALIARMGAGLLAMEGYRRLAFPSVQLDQAGAFRAASNEYEAPAGGLYRIAAQVTVEARHGELVRIAIAMDGRVIRETRAIAGGDGQQTVRVEAIHPLERGARISVEGHSSGGSTLAAGNLDIGSNNYFEIYQL